MSAIRATAALAHIPRSHAFEAAALASLGTAELEGLAAITHPTRRRDWLVGRALAKLLLAGCDDLHGVEQGEWPATIPSTWEVLRSPDGAPRAARKAPFSPETATLHLSLSHAGNWVAAAISGQMRLGIDVEAICAEPLLILQAADPAAASWICSARPQLRPRLATLVWTLKEAAAKAGRFGNVSATSILSAPILPAVTADHALHLLATETHSLSLPAWSRLPVRVAGGSAETAYARYAGPAAMASLVGANNPSTN